MPLLIFFLLMTFYFDSRHLHFVLFALTKHYLYFVCFKPQDLFENVLIFAIHLV